MRRYCTEVTGPKLANMLEQGKTPILSPAELADVGFSIAAYPLTLLSAAIKAQENALALLKVCVRVWVWVWVWEWVRIGLPEP
mmetsp:Transcript_41813/g.131000  ORF Transcript_41813/g.131000 Transcript_41813/m.131000 type:complete len:83 (+) Transcript_41813:147-395(+)